MELDLALVTASARAGDLLSPKYRITVGGFRLLRDPVCVPPALRAPIDYRVWLLLSEPTQLLQCFFADDGGGFVIESPLEREDL
jgi:hypothetical protein